MVEGQKRCPACQTDVALNAEFCSRCGNKFETRFVATVPTQRRCDKCGHRLSSFETTCSKCVTVPTAPTMSSTAPFPTAQNSPSPPVYTTGIAVVSAVPHVQCGACGQWVPQGSPQCQYCRAMLVVSYPQSAPVQQVIINTPMVPPQRYATVTYRSHKGRSTAAILAILLGGLGIHHFYLGKTAAGILSVLFCWTYIPAIIGLIQGIQYICMNDQDFDIRYGEIVS